MRPRAQQKLGSWGGLHGGGDILTESKSRAQWCEGRRYSFFVLLWGLASTEKSSLGWELPSTFRPSGMYFFSEEKWCYAAKTNTAAPLPSLSTHRPGEKLGDDGFIVFSVPSRDAEWTQGAALCWLCSWETYSLGSRRLKYHKGSLYSSLLGDSPLPLYLVHLLAGGRTWALVLLSAAPFLAWVVRVWRTQFIPSCSFFYSSVFPVG